MAASELVLGSCRIGHSFRPTHTFSLDKTKRWLGKYRWRGEMNCPWQGQLSFSSEEIPAVKTDKTKADAGWKQKSSVELGLILFSDSSVLY